MSGYVVTANRGRPLRSGPEKEVTKAPAGALRFDIQGLRAVAVLAVIADHVFAWPSGGFVGVDVFFVISGFLITGLLIREWQRTGTISFSKFYRRRIKRILPASMLVILTTALAAFFVFSMPRFATTTVDSVWAALFSANWRFLLQGSDYFQADGPVSPLRHYWSLAVEEQFYFVWPWVMLGALAWISRGGLSKSLALRFAGVVIAFISIGSFLWAVFETSLDPGAAYYSTLSRTWELGIGAMLAFVVPLCERIPHKTRPVIANAGLLGIGISLFTITPEVAFPAPGALLPVMSTVLVIGAGCGGDQRYLPILTNSVSRYLGDISFSLYLWHFPVIILLGAVLPSHGFFYFVMSLFVTFGLAVYSYELVEDPIRKSSWLSKSPDASAKKSAGRGRRDGLRPRKNRVIAHLAGLTVFLLIAGGVTAFKLWMSDATPPRTPAAAEAGFPPADVSGPEGRSLRAELSAAAAATSWPKFNPPLEVLMQEDPHPDRVFNCGTAGNHSASECTFGPSDAPKNAVLVGDSISQRWAFPLTKLYSNNGWNIRIFGRPGCPFNDYPMVKSPEEQDSCTERKEQAIAFIEETKPDLVIVGNTMVPERMSTTGKVATGADWQAGMESILSRISSSGKRLILSPPPFDKDVRECYTPLSSPSDCLGTVSSLWYEVAKADTAAAEATGTTYVDTRALFCTADDACPEFAGEVPIKMDHTHLTLPYGERILFPLREMLEHRGFLP